MVELRPLRQMLEPNQMDLLNRIKEFLKEQRIKNNPNVKWEEEDPDEDKLHNNALRYVQHLMEFRGFETENVGGSSKPSTSGVPKKTAEKPKAELFTVEQIEYLKKELTPFFKPRKKGGCSHSHCAKQSSLALEQSTDNNKEPLIVKKNDNSKDLVIIVKKKKDDNEKTKKDKITERHHHFHRFGPAYNYPPAHHYPPAHQTTSVFDNFSDENSVASCIIQ